MGLSDRLLVSCPSKSLHNVSVQRLGLRFVTSCGPARRPVPSRLLNGYCMTLRHRNRAGRSLHYAGYWRDAILRGWTEICRRLRALRAKPRWR